MLLTLEIRSLEVFETADQPIDGIEVRGDVVDVGAACGRGGEHDETSFDSLTASPFENPGLLVVYDIEVSECMLKCFEGSVHICETILRQLPLLPELSLAAPRTLLYPIKRLCTMMNRQQRPLEASQPSIEAREDARHSHRELIELLLVLGQELKLGQGVVVVLP